VYFFDLGGEVVNDFHYPAVYTIYRASTENPSLNQGKSPSDELTMKRGTYGW